MNKGAMTNPGCLDWQVVFAPQRLAAQVPHHFRAVGKSAICNEISNSLALPA